MSHYFFREDYQALADQIDGLKDEVRSTLADTAESAKQSSETWHDNFGFEEGQRRLKALTRHLDDLEAIRRQATVVEPDAPDGTVRFGSRVTVLEISTGEERTYRIGSYMTFAGRKDDVSYASPIALLLMGAVEGDVREGTVVSKSRTFKIIRVA